MSNGDIADKSSNLLEINGRLTSKQSINHQGSILINGDIDGDCYLIARDDIEVNGNIIHSKIKSTNGSIIVRGGIRGVTTQVQAGKDIETVFVYNATLRAGNNIRISELASDAHLIAKNSIYLEYDTGLEGHGTLEGGEAEAGIEIGAKYIGDGDKTTTIVKLTNFKQMDMFSIFTILDREMEETKKKISDLEKYIDVIRLIGKKVVTLPIEKKQELAEKVRKFNELQVHIQDIQNEKDRLNNENSSANELDRTIIAREMIFEGVYAYIDKIKLYLKENYKNVILYKKGIIIIGNFDEFMMRKKYA